MVIAPSDIDPATLVARLSDPDWRTALRAQVAAEQGSHLPLNNAFAAAAPRAIATAAQLREIVELLRAEGDEQLLRQLVFHPQLPEDVLLALAEHDLCIDSLGHRAGPRRLLQRLAEKYGYLEAILTLALDYYQHGPAAEFAAFARQHSQHEGMLRALAEVDGGDNEPLYEELAAHFPDAAAFHARYLAMHHPLARLEAFLDRCADAWVMVLLLNSDLADPDKRDYLLRRAEARAGDEEIASALSRHRARARAAQPDLTEDESAAFLAAGDPEVLLALAGNAHAPPSILQGLAGFKGTVLARRIRERARRTLNPRIGDYGLLRIAAA